MIRLLLYFFFFFFNDTATTEIYTLSLHDALPIWTNTSSLQDALNMLLRDVGGAKKDIEMMKSEYDRIKKDRKSTRLNSSHTVISYAVFCLKKKKKNKTYLRRFTLSNVQVYCW